MNERQLRDFLEWLEEAPEGARETVEGREAPAWWHGEEEAAREAAAVQRFLTRGR